MKISEEKFNKLCQLDRIEYRQKEDRIRAKYEGSLLLFGLYLFLVVLAFVLLAAGLNCNPFLQDYAQQVTQTLASLASKFFWIIIILFICDVISWVSQSKELGKLNEEFFKVEIKKR